MSHYLCGVVVPVGTTREAAPAVVTPLMSPFSEEDGDNEAGWWDFWLVGGRWTGVWSSRYKPSKDWRNYGKPCYICGGTGQREDIPGTREEYIAWVGGCNACYGTGSAMNWTLAPFPGDVISVDFLLSGYSCRDWESEHPFTLQLPFRLVLPDGTCPSREKWTVDGVVQDRYDSREDVTVDYTPLDDDVWDEQCRGLLEPWRGHNIVAVDYHS